MTTRTSCEPAVATPYSYVCIDRSYLVRPFCRYVVSGFAKHLPFGLPANLITLVSSACAWGSLAAAAWGHIVVSVALMALYVLFDHADGIHARRTGTSGPLGEYFDHFLDVFHAPVALLTVAAAAGRMEAPVLVIGMGVMLGAAALMVEQHETGVLHFGVLGPLEGMLVTIGCIASCAGPQGAAFWREPVLGGATPLDLGMGLSLVGGLTTATCAMVRMKRAPADLVAYVASSGMTAAGFWLAGIPTLAIVAVLMAQAGDYTGGIIGHRVTGRVRPRPDYVGPLLAIACALVRAPAATWLFDACLLFLVLKVVARCRETLRRLRRFWRWWNRATTAG